MSERAGGEDDPLGGSPLSWPRSFVLQFTSDTAPRAGSFRGRVEHIDTGRSRRFTSLDDLVAFIVRVLETSDGEERP